MALQVGDRLGYYDVTALLGTGGMSAVYAAVDTRLDRRVALKVLSPALAGHQETRQRFIREAKAASALDHANICTLYEIGEKPDGELYLAMAYYDGETLKARIARSRLSVDEAVDITSQVAAGLSRAHDSGIVHRDIKPANIMLTDQGDVKILDFGIAKLAGHTDLTKTGTLLGTAAYLSPEQVRGEPVDARSDVWALGVVLYEMLTGELPFDAEQVVAQVNAIANDDPTHPDVLRPDLPKSLTTVTTRALEKDRGKRYQSATEFRSDLASHHTSSGDLTGGATTPAAAAEAGRPKVVVPAAATLVSIVMAALLWSSWRSVAPVGRDTPTLTISPLTDAAGLSLSGSWSPDGSQIAYDHTQGGTMDIAVMSIGGGESRPLAGGPHDEMMPRWSPDGTKVAYLLDEGTGLGLYWVPPTGGLSRKLADTHFPYLDRFTSIGAIGSQPWSPDGRRVVFSRLDALGQVALWQVDVVTGEETRLTDPTTGTDMQASWSHDGEFIAFVRVTVDGSTSLYRVATSDTAPELVLADDTRKRSPIWTLDDRSLVFAAYTGSFGGDLWEIDLDSRRVRQMTVGAGASTPILSSTGRIAYSRWNHETFFFRMQLGATTDHDQISLSGGNNFGQRFSPDGRQIVFQSARSGSSQIWLHDVVSGNERQITNPPTGAEDRTPDWSPDGTQVVFLSNREGPFQLWVTPVDGGPATRISAQAIPMDGDWWVNARVAPRWSKDGRVIAYLAPGNQDSTLWLIEPDGRNAHQTTLSGVLRFDWYDDGQQVIYTRRIDDGSGRIEMLATDLETDLEVRLLEANATELSVSPDRRSVAYNSADGHFSMNRWLLPLRVPGVTGTLPSPAGEPQQLTFGDGVWHVHGGAWTPDGTSIVYTRDLDSGNLYVIDNYR